MRNLLFSNFGQKQISRFRSKWQGLGFVEDHTFWVAPDRRGIEFQIV